MHKELCFPASAEDISGVVSIVVDSENCQILLLPQDLLLSHRPARISAVLCTGL